MVLDDMVNVIEVDDDVSVMSDVSSPGDDQDHAIGGSIVCPNMVIRDSLRSIISMETVASFPVPPNASLGPFSKRMSAVEIILPAGDVLFAQAARQMSDDFDFSTDDFDDMSSFSSVTDLSTLECPIQF